MNNLHIIDLAKYEAPEVVESKREDWVTYGESNSYFNFLIDRYKNSTTNNAIINNISRLIYGRGLFALDANKKPNEYAQMMTLFNQDCLRKLAFELKALGQCAIQVHYTKDHSKIVKAYHIPVQLLAPEKCNKDGEIEAYYYSDNWEDIRKFPPKRIDAFGFSNNEVEILYIKPYSIGMKYFSYVDYQGALSYAMLEEEVANYLINEVQNSFSGTKIVNFNNGVPTPEQQDQITSQVLGKLTGSQGRKVIVSFNDNVETRTSVEDIPLNDAPDHYTYLSEECLRKIMLGHNVTSPLLFGIASSNGFSSNADELRNSTILFENMVIKPYQELLIEGLDKILAYNGASLKLYFETLNPLDADGDLTTNNDKKRLLESINNLSPLVANKVIESMTPNEIRSIVGLTPEKGGSDLEDGTMLSKDSVVAQSLIDLGEDPNENWLLIDESAVDYDNDDSENETLSKEPKQSLLSKVVNLVSTGSAFPNSKSTQDENIDGVKFITRYVYQGNTTTDSREFCRKMMLAKKIYRKEDILRMSTQAVNAGWGPEGADLYSIWLYKGGGNCNHRWNKQVYASFEGTGIDVNSPKAKRVAVRKAEKLGYVVKNEPKVSTLPKDMPYNGFLPTNKIYGK
jgi:hypothetical protein